MVGGRAFMVGGRLALGVVGDDLMVRLTGAAYEAALEEPHVRPMTLGGRRLKSYLLVGPAGVASDANLAAWIDRATEPESGSQ